MAQADRVSGNQNREKHKKKKRMVTSGFQVGRIGFRPNGKKKGKVKLPDGEAEKGIPQHIPKKVANQGLSKESKLKEGKNEKREMGLTE